MSFESKVLVPWRLDQDIPSLGLRIDVFDGSSDPPTDLNNVEFYVVPYGCPKAFDLIARLPALRVLQVLTAGYDQVLPLLPPGVDLHNGRGLHDASTAEHAVALILAAQRDLPKWFSQQDDQLWSTEYTRSLADSHVLIVGHGNVGSAIEDRLRPFEVTITRVARRSRPQDDVHSIKDLADLVPLADIIVLALPHTPHTRGILGAVELAQMRDDALIVNVGRGPALDTTALLAQEGRVRAALDVVDPEPLPRGHALWTAPGVLLTPHVAGGSAAFQPRARAFVREQVGRWAHGEPLANPVDVPVRAVPADTGPRGPAGPRVVR